ncbi:MAG TPA: BON domain-containing protein [Clostridia bacterium]|nr:BON domain-containing protein [Clostridia bacterium]
MRQDVYRAGAPKAEPSPIAQFSGRKLLQTIVVYWMPLALLLPVQAQQAPEDPAPANSTSQGITVSEAPRSTPNESDLQLARSVERRFETDKWVPGYKMGVQALDGRVTLSGTVDNLLTKERAVQLAQTVPGVRTIADQIKVAVPARQDWEIRTDVAMALRTNAAGQADAIETQVQKGFVTLSGVVPSEYKKLLAGSLAKSIPGVRGVENQLQIALSTARSDEEILAEVMSRLQWEPWLSNPQLSINVNEGRVTLAGFVESQRARNQALKSAWVPGVTSVDGEGLQVVDNLQAAYLPPNAPASARERATDAAGRGDLAKVESAPGAIIDAPTNPPAPRAVGGARTETGVGTGAGQGQPPIQDRSAMQAQAPIQATPGTVTSLTTVLSADNASLFAGQRARFSQAKVVGVLSDRVLLIGTEDGTRGLPVRLPTAQPQIQPGMTLEVSGVLAPMPEQLRWWDISDAQREQLVKSALFLNASEARAQGTPQP